MNTQAATTQHTTKPVPPQPKKTSPIGKLLACIALALALLISTNIVNPEPAAAHTNGHTECITNWKTGWWNVTMHARNDCDHTINMKFQITFGKDTACTQVPAGSTLVREVGWGSARGKGVPC